RLQELQPRRHVREEVANLHDRAWDERPGALLKHLAGANADAGAGAAALDVSEGRDAGEGLAAEPEGGDRVEVGQRGDLAGGVARERERQLVGVDAAAVVADANGRPPGAPHVDGDA